MSYDLQVWSIYPATRTSLKDGLNWEDEQSTWVHAGHAWQIVVSHSDRVLPEDIPDEAVALLPGIQYLTQLNLEGKSSEASRRLVLSVATILARTCHGVLADPQEGTCSTPSGIKRLEPFRPKERFSILVLSWWFLDGPLLNRAGRERMLDLLRRDLPEALPKRYGTYEPPQHVYVEEGPGRFLDFLDHELSRGLTNCLVSTLPGFLCSSLAA